MISLFDLLYCQILLNLEADSTIYMILRNGDFYNIIEAMKLKTFTQAYFLIKCNSSYEHSLVKRAKAIANTFVLIGAGAYMWYPTRIYTNENIS